jgi:hypothetical protein
VLTDRELVAMTAGFFAVMALHQGGSALIHSSKMKALGGRASRGNWVPCIYWAALAGYAAWKAWA